VSGWLVAGPAAALEIDRIGLRAGGFSSVRMAIDRMETWWRLSALRVAQE
jgi:hypothetical protein